MLGFRVLGTSHAMTATPVLVLMAALVLFIDVCRASPSFTTTNYTVIANVPFILSWEASNTTRSPFSIDLVNGTEGSVNVVSAIAVVSVGTSLSWTPPTSLPSGRYRFRIKEDLGSGLDYSPEFNYIAAVTTTGQGGPSTSVTVTPNTAPAGSGLGTAAIIGIAIGSVGGVLLLVALYFLFSWCSKGRAKRRASAAALLSTPYASPALPSAPAPMSFDAAPAASIYRPSLLLSPSMAPRQRSPSPLEVYEPPRSPPLEDVRGSGIRTGHGSGLGGAFGQYPPIPVLASGSSVNTSAATLKTIPQAVVPAMPSPLPPTPLSSSTPLPPPPPPRSTATTAATIIPRRQSSRWRTQWRESRFLSRRFSVARSIGQHGPAELETNANIPEMDNTELPRPDGYDSFVAESPVLGVVEEVRDGQRHRKGPRFFGAASFRRAGSRRGLGGVEVVESPVLGRVQPSR